MNKITSLQKIGFLFSLSMSLTLAVPSFAQENSSNTTSKLPEIQKARTLYQQGNFTEAVPVLQQAIQTFAAQGDKLNQAMALSNLAATYAQLYQWNSAQNTITTALSIVRSASESTSQQRILADSLDIQGQIYLQQGQPDNAYDTWTEANQVYINLNLQPQYISTQVQRNQALQVMGLYPKACFLLVEALGIAKDTCKSTVKDNQIALQDPITTLKNQSLSIEKIRAINSLGHILRVSGQLEESQELLLLGLAAAQQLNDTQAQAEIYLNLGNTIRTIANQPSLGIQQKQSLENNALSAYQKAEQLTKSSLFQKEAKINQFSLLVSQKNWLQAGKVWQELQTYSNQNIGDREGIFAQINLVENLMELSTETNQANLIEKDIETLIATTKEQAQNLGNKRLQAYALGIEGKFYEQQKKWQKAQLVTKEALSLAPAFQRPEITYLLLWQLGRIDAAQGNVSTAISNYTEAVKILSSLRSDLVTVNPEVQYSFKKSVEPVYRELVSLLLQETNPSQDKLKQARSTIESLQVAELDNFFGDACADIKPQLIDEIDSQAAIIYPIVLKDSLDVIISISGQPLRHHKIAISKTELEATFKQSLASMNQLSFTKERLRVAQQLYDWIIRPEEKNLSNNQIKTLVFVPDGALRNVSLATLYNGKEYLIQKYSVAVAPGLKLIAPKPLAKAGLTAIAGGLTESRQGFGALPAVAAEVKQIAEELRVNVLLNQRFTTEQLQEEIKQISSPIIHLATHGQFSSNAIDTFILTWDKRVNVKEFDELLRSRSQQEQTPIELLVLSACQTAAGDERAALGLAGVAIRSGARSTLGTLWYVDDQSTAIFMGEFYRQLIQEKTTKAQAVRNAQLKLLQNPQFQHPYFWAPFILVGNWQ